MDIVIMDFRDFYKYILNFLIGLAFISLNIINRTAHARNLSDLSELSRNSTNAEIERNFSFGAEYIHIFVNGKGDYGTTFRRNQPGGNLYIGYNWNSIMLEMGYSWTTRKSKEFFLRTPLHCLGHKITILQL